MRHHACQRRNKNIYSAGGRACPLPGDSFGAAQPAAAAAATDHSPVGVPDRAARPLIVDSAVARHIRRPPPATYDGRMTADAIAAAVTLRAARPADVDDIARIISRPPEPPMAAALGPELASRISELFVRSGVTVSLSHATVATIDDDVVGVMDAGYMRERRTPLTVIRMLPRTLAVLGARKVRRGLYTFYVSRRVQFAAIPAAFPVSQLYVDERWRNRGIGGRLLQHADALAARAGAKTMCIETGIDNPARRLYERHGFRVAATSTDVDYERVTRSPGRVLMLKSLG
jgi:GNAT superfamily N-acetyltransferase